MSSQIADGVLPTFTAEEQAYFDNRGNAPEPVEEEENEVLDVVEDDEEDIDHEDEAETGEDEPEKPKKQVVPIKALHKEREARKQFEQQFRQAELERARMEERMNVLLERFQAPQQAQQEEKPVSFDEDPFAAMQDTRTKAEQLEAQLRSIQQAEQARIEFEQMKQFAAYHEQQFSQEKPDYLDAVHHLKGNRLNELQTVFGFNPVQAQQILEDEEKQIIIAAARTGRSPAEMAYTIAQQRGYRPKAAEDPRMQDVKPSTKSLSQASGTATGAKITAQDLIRMSPDEFERFASRNPKKLKQLMGG